MPELTYQVLVDMDVYPLPNTQLLVLKKKKNKRENKRKFINGKFNLYTNIICFNELNNNNYNWISQIFQLKPSLRNKLSWIFLFWLLKTMYTAISLTILLTWCQESLCICCICNGVYIGHPINNSPWFFFQANGVPGESWIIFIHYNFHI